MLAKKIISLFSGAGGMDIGFRDAGFETAVMVEYDPSCCKTLRFNCPGIPVIEGDIRNVPTGEMLSAATLDVLEAALVIGGPPCQSFSLAGKRMGMDDPRGQLVLEFARVVREALPIGFVMENVRGMMNWEGGKAIEAIIEEFRAPIWHQGKSYSYDIDVKVLNAAAV
jgi:DNA (cytosine-5)-methyltransferase 1